jgi:hypothetical protein
MRRLLQSVLSALALSFLLAAYLVSAETLHLNQRNPYFISDLGARTLLGLLGWYALFALVVGVPIGLSIRERRWQAFALALVGFLLISLKIFWVDSSMLTTPKIAVAFACFTAGWFVAIAYASHRLSLPNMAPIVLTVAYAHVCLAVASRWSIGGGRLLPFVFSRSTLTIVLVGCVGVVAVIAVQRALERRPARWWSAIVPVTILAAQMTLVAASAQQLPTAKKPEIIARADSPDIYIVSFDAMRTDAFKAFVAAHPTSHLATIAAQATMFENVVSHGPATDVILANNTFAGAARTSCDDTVPAQLAARGYATVMAYARLGKRFDGSDCYQHYYSVAAATLMSRYAVPAVSGALSHREHLLQQQGRAGDLIAKLQKFSSVNAPLFSYLHFLELHAPYVPKSRRRDADFAETMNEFMTGCYTVACDQTDPQNAKVIELARQSYAQLLDEVDDAVGAVLEIATRRKRDFVLVVTADHGELLGEHGGFAHTGGFVGELLDIPFVVFDSRVRRPDRRCELMLSSEAVKATALSAAQNQPPSYPDREILELDMPPLGRGQIDKARATIHYELADEVLPQAGTWRNIHRDQRGTLAYPIERCE